MTFLILLSNELTEPRMARSDMVYPMNWHGVALDSSSKMTILQMKHRFPDLGTNGNVMFE